MIQRTCDHEKDANRGCGKDNWSEEAGRNQRKQKGGLADAGAGEEEDGMRPQLTSLTVDRHQDSPQ